MKRTMLALATAVGLLTAAGCADVTAPQVVLAETVAKAAAGDPGTLTFSSTKSYEGGQAESAVGGTGSISFQGSVQTANPCYEVTGAHRARNNTVTVTVTAASTGGICTQVITYHNYGGAVSGLAAGTYDFQIVEVVGGRSTTVLTQQVTVL